MTACWGGWAGRINSKREETCSFSKPPGGKRTFPSCGPSVLARWKEPPSSASRPIDDYMVSSPARRVFYRPVIHASSIVLSSTRLEAAHDVPAWGAVHSPDNELVRPRRFILARLTPLAAAAALPRWWADMSRSREDLLWPVAKPGSSTGRERKSKDPPMRHESVPVSPPNPSTPKSVRAIGQQVPDDLLPGFG